MTRFVGEVHMEVILASLLACLDSYFKRSFRFLHVSILVCFSLQVFLGGNTIRGDRFRREQLLHCWCGKQSLRLLGCTFYIVCRVAFPSHSILPVSFLVVLSCVTYDELMHHLLLRMPFVHHRSIVLVLRLLSFLAPVIGDTRIRGGSSG